MHYLLPHRIVGQYTCIVQHPDSRSRQALITKSLICDILNSTIDLSLIPNILQSALFRCASKVVLTSRRLKGGALFKSGS
jgi:hypothetical protein